MRRKIICLFFVACGCYGIHVTPQPQPQVVAIIDNTQLSGTESRNIQSDSLGEIVGALQISFAEQQQSLVSVSVEMVNLDVSGGRKKNSPAKTMHLLDAAGVEVAAPVDVPLADDGVGGQCFCGPVTFLLNQPLPTIDAAGSLFQVLIDVVEVAGSPVDPHGVVSGTQAQLVVPDGSVQLTGADYFSDHTEGAVMTFIEFLNGGCGDGVVDAGEECDDGNTVAGDGCNGFCLLELQDPAKLVPATSNDLLQVYLSGSAAQEFVGLSFTADPTAGVLPTIPAKSMTLCWVDAATGLAPSAPLSANLGLKDSVGAIVAPAVAVDALTGCAVVVLNSTFSLAIGDQAKVLKVFGDVLSASSQQRLVLVSDAVLGSANEVVGNTSAQSLGRLAYAGLVNCLMQDVTNPVLADQSALPVADMICTAVGESVTMNLLQWDMTKVGQAGSINNFSVQKDGAGLSGSQVGCSAPAGVNQCLIFQPTAEVLVPGVPTTYQLKIDVAGTGAGASQTWVANILGFSFTASDGQHDGTGLLAGSATVSN